MTIAGANPIIFVAGTTGFLELHVTRRGIPVPLSTEPAAVTVTVERGTLAPLIDRPATVVDAASGIARLYWQPGDLEAPDDEPITYRAEVTVDGETQPVPTTFTVRPPLARQE